jgi:hypothetical protein
LHSRALVKAGCVTSAVILANNAPDLPRVRSTVCTEMAAYFRIYVENMVDFDKNVLIFQVLKK